MPATRPVFTPFATEAETIRVTPEIARCGLLDWAAGFKLGTAGYRDLLDPEDLHNTEVPFNSLNLAVMLSARAQMALEDGLADLHVGGEVRPHTQAFIDLSARIYAAAGLTVHLRPAGLDTTDTFAGAVKHRGDTIDRSIDEVIVDHPGDPADQTGQVAGSVDDPIDDISIKTGAHRGPPEGEPVDCGRVELIKEVLALQHRVGALHPGL